MYAFRKIVFLLLDLSNQVFTAVIKHLYLKTQLYKNKLCKQRKTFKLYNILVSFREEKK